MQGEIPEGKYSLCRAYSSRKILYPVRDRVVYLRASFPLFLSSVVEVLLN